MSLIGNVFSLRTRTFQTVRPFLERVQNRVLRVGQAVRLITDSGGMLGNAGLVISSFGDAVGKYIAGR